MEYKCFCNHEKITLPLLQDSLDVMREEALDKQLDDERHLTEAHDQLSALRGKNNCR